LIDIKERAMAGDSYTVTDAVHDWLDKGLKGRDENTVTANRILADQHVIPLIGATRLKGADRGPG
jgi:hypothetical protein